MLIREIVDAQLRSIDQQMVGLRKRKRQITADRARQRANKAADRASKSRQLAAQAQARAQQSS